MKIVGKSEYMGDGVWAKWDGMHVVLFTGEPFAPENVVCLEGDVFETVVEFAESCFGPDTGVEEEVEEVEEEDEEDDDYTYDDA